MTIDALNLYGTNSLVDSKGETFEIRTMYIVAGGRARRKIIAVSHLFLFDNA